eukprot:TRINITY_DN105749_c0_g1_i1.p1 TRINITY_DN105749_c0_g1~~TRINITY_DN105749_c0_g1_i1.p1  ORF type:complete len:776 (-),score=177.85 TRINITY_DN105749_c0_g1_i1:237-2564(-)
MMPEQVVIEPCVENAEFDLTLDGAIEVHRPGLHACDEDDEDEPQWGGGVPGLTMKIGILAAELENTREGCHKLACESEEIVQAIFERLGILHCRTSRIETALGLPPWQPPESPSGDGAQSPRSQWANPDGADGNAECRDRMKCCLRGHPLQPDEEGQDGPPRQCGFCKCRKQTVFQCSEGCYFHACMDCVLGSEAQGGPECEACEGPESLDTMAPQQETVDCESNAPPKDARGGSNESHSPSRNSDEETSGCSTDAACSGSRPSSGRSRPMTPSTALPEEQDCSVTEISSRRDDDSPYGMPEGMPWLPGAESEAAAVAHGSEPSKPPRLPKEGGANGLKARLCALEAEVRELASSIYSTPTVATLSPGADAGFLKEAVALAAQTAEACCATLQEELQQTAMMLKKEVKSSLDKFAKQQAKETSAVSEEFLHQELGRCEATLRKQFQESTETFEKELMINAETMRRLILETQETTEHRVHARVGDCKATLRAELSGCAEELRRELADTSMAPPSGNGIELHETLEGLHMRLDALEGDLPRGRVRASRGKAAASQVFAAEENEGRALQGLARGLTAVAKSLGLARSGEHVGCDDWSWDEVGWRIEEAWTARAKESWHLGLPPKPDLFDFLQSQARQVSASSTAPGVPRMPDRREAARLANRLASTSPAPVAPPSPRNGGNDVCSSERAVEADSPTRRSSSASGLGAGPMAAQALPLPSRLNRNRTQGHDAAEAWGEFSDANPFQRQHNTSRSSQRASSFASQRNSSSGRLPPKSEGR